ncbi:MAG: hypothetical protein J4431_01785 [Candidatus Aenigmarchaeota archaeon]|nr:hypothetical protein [Candidatus Aenigmarchaeota archaeon]
MKFYIASRFGKAAEVKEMTKKLEEMGHSVTTDWTQHGAIKPYSQNASKAMLYSIEDVQGVLNSDVFILITDEGGKGMYVELGVAIASFIEKKTPRIYIVGAHNENTIFFFHPSVSRKDSIQDVLDDIRP